MRGIRCWSVHRCVHGSCERVLQHCFCSCHVDVSPTFQGRQQCLLCRKPGRRQDIHKTNFVPQGAVCGRNLGCQLTQPLRASHLHQILMHLHLLQLWAEQVRHVYPHFIWVLGVPRLVQVRQLVLLVVTRR
jgi:hypothetical protein